MKRGKEELADDDESHSQVHTTIDFILSNVLSLLVFNESRVVVLFPIQILRRKH